MPGNNISATGKNNYTSVPVYRDMNGSSPVEMNSIRVDESDNGHRNSTSHHQDGRSTNAKEMRVYYTGSKDCKRTKLEQYLIVLCLLLICTCVVVIGVAFFKDNSDSTDYCLTDHCVRTAAQLLEAIDDTVDPCYDFYQYACGTWNKKYIIPEDKSSFNTFEKLQDELLTKLKRLLEEKPNDYDTKATLKAKVLYESCINTSQIEHLGITPLYDLLSQLKGWPVLNSNWTDEQWDFEEVLGHLKKTYSSKSILIKSAVSVDDKNSSRRIIKFDQPSLGMPSREYFLKDQESEYTQAYLNYMIHMAMLLGANETFASSEMRDVLDFEIRLANATTPQNQRHDTGARYTKIKIKDLQRRIPQIDWLEYLNNFMPTTITADEDIVSFAMDFLDKLGVLMEEQKRRSKRVIANYLLWRLIMEFASQMTESFQQERNEYRKVLEGISRDKGRWQKCVEFVNERMGMAVGRLFLRENFRKESKEVALEMIHNIRAAFNEILEKSDWMDDATKAVAKEKANAMNERIGYPEFILQADRLDQKYDGLEFNVDTYFENVLRLERHDAEGNLGKLRKPVLKDEWDQDPAVVNAFYNPNTNDIVFPAAILQPLFYDANFPKSLNYGGIGVVIGHEITHGFDDKGRQYDKEGNMRQWWNNDTITEFRKRAQCIIDQYSTYTLQPFGYKIDGRNTQGENIADNGGLKESFRAYRKWVERNGEEKPLPGINLSHNQLFFLNYAQIWCGIMRGEEALHKIRTSVHSPGQIRVQGPLSNSYDFAEAYNCPVGSRMNPEKKCSVW